LRMPQIPSEFKMPSVGAWSEYRVVGEDKDTVLFKYALTGKEKCDEVDCYWYEFQVTEKDEKNIVKMLVSGDPSLTGNLKRLIVKNGDDPAVEIPVATMEAHDDEGEPESEEASAKPEKPAEVGVETIETPAGKLKCKHLRVKTEEDQVDLWVSEKIPFFNLAKMNQKDSSMEVIGYGDSGAKTGITEEPQKLPIPGLPTERR
jgi:hypothetical protein